MTASPRVVIVGGGIVGLCTAWHLAERGCRNVIVCEQAQPGAGSTGRASGGIRQQFARETEVRMAVESVAFWQRFDAAFGAQMEFRQVGYLYLLTTPKLLQDAVANVAMQNACGAPSRMLGRSEIAKIAPDVDLDGVLGGSFCPTDGRARPMGAIAGLAAALPGRGVDIRQECEVTAVHVEAGRVTGVTAGGAFLGADVVVNAGGPHAAQIAAMVGLGLPVRATRMHQFVTGAIAGLVPGQPVLVEPETTLFVAQEGAALLLGMRQAGSVGEHLDVDWEFWPAVREAARRRVPKLAGATVETAWTGLVEMSPDHVGILGTVPEVAGFICANGLSGHGFMLAPAVGRIAAALALEEAVPDIDLTVLSPQRFRQAA